MTIVFKSKKAREFLLRNGFVYTLRKRRKKIGKDWVTDKRGGKKLANVKVSIVTMITPYNIDDLKDYVQYSGFDNLSEWLTEALELNGSFPLFLYKVEVIGDQ